MYLKVRSFGCLLFLISCLSIYGQNLVPNPSFEQVGKATQFWMPNDQAFETLMKDVIG